MCISSFRLSVNWNITEVRTFRLITVLQTGSKSTASNNSKKTSSSSSTRKTTSSSSHKMPSGNSKKKSARSKAKEQTLRRYAWAYVGILFALIIVPLILRSRLIVQTASVSSMWIGLYWFSTVVDHIVISSHKWLPCIVPCLYQQLQWHFLLSCSTSAIVRWFLFTVCIWIFGLLLIVMVICWSLFAYLMSIELWLISRMCATGYSDGHFGQFSPSASPWVHCMVLSTDSVNGESSVVHYNVVFSDFTSPIVLAYFPFFWTRSL